MKVLVTGASGMLGRATALALATRGDEVTVLQRRPSGLADQPPTHDGGPRIREVLGDIADAEVVRSAAAGQDGIVHLAARVGVVGTAEEFERANVEGTLEVVAAARAGNVPRLVHVSTPSVAHAGEPLVGAGADPADPAHTIGHYARTKARAEQIALGAADGLAVVAIRPHLVWGPGDRQLVGRIVARARAGRLALVDDGAALIDTTYLDNAVDALVAALDRAENDEVRGRAFVVSNGQPRTVAELLARICRAAGLPGPQRHVPLRVAHAGGAVAERVWARLHLTDDPPMTSFLAEQLATAHWFDQREVRAALDWRPRVGLEEGFDRLAAWFANAPTA
ncbi:MAG: NAD-dependent epimerase/dehydratase family protein [Nitriliruptoraceae bacterium]